MKPFPIRWKLSKNEGPNWEDAGRVVDLSHYKGKDLDEFSDLFHECYQNDPGTKIGGWPGLIQHETDHESALIFQIGSEEKPNWSWTDSGTAYFFLSKNGEWKFECQFY